MKSYRFVSDLYLEWFDDDALLLVAGHDLLLTLNRAGGALFGELTAAFGRRSFTLAEGEGWLGDHYDLTVATCRKQARGLLAFSLKHHLVEPVAVGAEGAVNA